MKNSSFVFERPEPEQNQIIKEHLSVVIISGSGLIL